MTRIMSVLFAALLLAIGNTANAQRMSVTAAYATQEYASLEKYFSEFVIEENITPPNFKEPYSFSSAITRSGLHAAFWNVEIEAVPDSVEVKNERTVNRFGDHGSVEQKIVLSRLFLRVPVFKDYQGVEKSSTLLLSTSVSVAWPILVAPMECEQFPEEVVLVLEKAVKEKQTVRLKGTLRSEVGGRTLEEVVARLEKGLVIYVTEVNGMKLHCPKTSQELFP